MRRFTLLVFIGIISILETYGQCPPPGFPDSGNTCPQAPILCENLDGYCNTINNNNVPQSFPGCSGMWQLNNDEWFAFYAGTTTIGITVTPSNCTANGNNQGMQGGIYDGCGGPVMDVQCSCTEDPFNLWDDGYVVGQIYWFVLDGCGGDVCDYEITVYEGSTVGAPPDDPDPIDGPTPVCGGDNESYFVPEVTGATEYTWTLTPSNAGTLSGGNDEDVNVAWNTNFSGDAELCLEVANACYTNQDTLCYTIHVVPVPTATLTGMGFMCQGSNTTIDLTVTFTGEGPWEFTPYLDGVAQTPIQTSDNPYTLQVDQPGNWTIDDLFPVGLACEGTTSGNVNIQEIIITPTATTVSATCGQSNGSIDLSVSGGDAPYTFNWSTGDMTEDLSNVPPGTYDVTVTDDNNCTGTLSVTVDDEMVTLTPTAAITPNTGCTGFYNGAIDLSVSPSGMYTYDWSNGETTEDLSNLDPGTYTVTVTGGVNCTATAEFTVDDNPNEPMATYTVVESTCDLDNGSINLTVTGGVTPYTFNWSNGETTEDINDLLAGDYSVTVTGANGCTDVADITVGNNNPPINIAGTTMPNTSCDGNGTGSIDITVTPGGSYTFDWSNGETTEDVTGLLPGGYSVTVTGQGSCSATLDFTIDDQPNEPMITYTTVESTCDLDNGSINVTVTGGVTPYTFNWSNGETTEDLNNVLAGDYSVTVTGANGCTDEADINVGNNNPPINISGTTMPNTSCDGNGTGSIDITVTPGGAYTFTWSNGETTEDVTGLLPGGYSVTVTGQGSCSATLDFTIDDQPNEPMITYTTVESTCDLDNGSINVTVTGGVTPYTFNWSNGETTEDLNNLLAGDYSVTVTGANGCTDEADINVGNNNPPINISATTMPNTSCDGNGTGSIDVTISPSGSYTFEWSNGATTEDLSNLLPGSYSITVTGQGSCSATLDIDLDDQPNEPMITYTTVESTCDLVNGSINVSVTGGVTPYTFNWSSGETTEDLMNILAGDYSLTVTGANGCTDVADINVGNNNPPISVTAVTTGNTTCDGNYDGTISISIVPSNGSYTFEWSNGATTQNQTGLPAGDYTVTVTGLGSCNQVETFTVPEDADVPLVVTSFVQTTCDLENGSISVVVNGSVPPFTYEWSNGATTQNLVNIPAGTYFVTVSAANGCTTVEQIDVPNFNPPIGISANVIANTTCINGNGSIDLTVNPPAGYTYTWSNGATVPDLNNLLPGDYTVTVSNGGTCEEIMTFTIDDNPNLPFPTFTFNDPSCGLSNGSINLTVTDGVTPYTYSWSNGATTQDLNNIPADIYIVTITGANGCTIDDGVVLNDIDIPVSIDGFVNGVTSCVTGNGSINLVVTPAIATILWDNGSSSPMLNNLPAGSYSVTVSALAGGTCTETATYDVYDEQEYPSLSTDIVDGYCGIPNGSVDLEVDFGVTPYTYHWSNNGNSQDLNNLAEGTYTVTVTSSVGCTAETTVYVENNPLPIQLNGIIYDNLSCIPPLNGAIDLEVDPMGYPYIYTWSNGQSNPSLNNLSPGLYSVTVQLGPECIFNETYEVLDASASPNLSVSGISAICGLPNGGANLTPTGASPPYSYLWSNGATTEDLSNVVPGTYTVTVTDFFDCSATTSVVITNNNVVLNLAGVTTQNTSCVAANGGIDITVTPASTYNYIWSNGSTSEDLSNIPAGMYTVTVSAGSSCISSDTYVVTNNTSDPVITPDITAAICTNPNGEIDLTITNGQQPFVFNWSNGSMTEDLTGLLPGTYTVTVTDANGCTADSILFVPNNSSTFSLAGAIQALSNCATLNGAVDLTVTPAGPYTYLWSNGATTQDISGVTAGIYTVEVTETGTCTASISFIIPDNRTYPALTRAITAEICDLLNGSIDLSVNGGAMPYNYAWSSGENTQDLANLMDGTYTVTVTGSNNCTASITAVIPDNSVNFALTSNLTPNTSCVASNGALDLMVSPPDPGFGLSYTYAWSNGFNTEDLANLAAGTYTVTVSAGGTCTGTANYSIINNTVAPTIAEVLTPAFCGQTSGAIDVTLSGGVTPYSYNWSNGATTEDISGVPSGNYSLTVTGANGCTRVKNYMIPENVTIPQIIPNISANTACIGINGAISLNVTPAVLNYTYMWSNGAITPGLQNITGGTYSVTVSGGGSCIATASIVVPNTIPVVTLSGTPTNVLCFSENTGAIDMTVNGGNAPFTYSWSPAVGTTEDLTDLTAGTYSVTVSDVNGCTSATMFTITQPASSVQIQCAKVNDISTPISLDGTGSVNITGGVAPYTVTWAPGGTQANVPAGLFTINNLAQGNFQVTVTDVNGCPVNCDFDIGLTPCETAVGEMGNANISLCGSGCITADYNAVGQFLDPNDVLQFILHEGSGNQIVNEIARSTQPTFCFDAATMTYGTTYYISAVAGNSDPNGNVIIGAYCTVISAPTPVVFYQIPVAGHGQPLPLNCVVREVNLVGTSSLTGSSFQWSTQNGILVGNTNQAVTKAGQAGDYTLIVTRNGCSDTTMVTVNDISNNPMAIIAATPDDLLDCVIDEITLSGSVEGTFDANTIWIGNGNIYPPGTVIQINDPGIYEFVILDTITMCSDTALININQNLVYPPLFIDPPGLLTCSNPAVTLNGGSPFPGINFTWATVVGTDTTILGTGTSLPVNTAGTYVLIGIDPANQCTNAMDVMIDANQIYPVADAGLGFSIKCFGETANLDGSGSSGNGTLGFVWSTSNGNVQSGSNTANPLISKPGTYQLVVTDLDNGCTDTDDVVIDPIDPTAMATVVQPPCYGDKGSIIVDEVIGGQPPVLFSLNGGSFSAQNRFLNLQPGPYTVVVQDAEGCSTTLSTVLVEPDEFVLFVEPTFTIALGDSVYIATQINVALSEIQSVVWTPSTGLSCDSCLETWAKPYNSTLYNVEVTTEAGCRDNGQVRVLVRPVDVYIPNVFSPNDDGVNDVFTVFADQKGVRKVNYLQVFSRWGELLWERYDFDPNNLDLGWDGTFRGKDMNPAVFVYHAEVEFIDGHTQLYKGDVTIVR
ncbi:MAG: gliding motility-associated C-terminal domain-containing protein [Saprospiraceae bacterium]